jgi:hypothetical protein
LFGVHDWAVYGQIAPPAAWADDGLPVFRLKRCAHCSHTDYDMVWPGGVVIDE